MTYECSSTQSPSLLRSPSQNFPAQTLSPGMKEIYQMSENILLLKSITPRMFLYQKVFGVNSRQFADEVFDLHIKTFNIVLINDVDTNCSSFGRIRFTTKVTGSMSIPRL